MNDILFRTVCTFLIVYGLYCLIINLYGCIKASCRRSDPSGSMIVIKVRNHEESIEGIVRNLIIRLLKNTHSSSVPDILIVDFNSEDSTAEIARRLSEDFSFVYYTPAELYLKAAESADSNKK